MRLITALLMLCLASTASAADPSNGPVFGIWHIDGHGYQWQRDQIDAGLPMEPCVRMFKPHLIDGSEAVVSSFDGGSIQLRMDNITSEIDRTIPRVDPLTEDNWRQSHLCIRLDPTTGELDDTPTPCIFAGQLGLDAWAETGRLC